MTTTLLSQVAVDVRNNILATHKPNSCIETTRLAILVLDRLGLPARAQSVRAAILNVQARDLIERGVPMAQWPPSAWSLACGYDTNPNEGDDWSGHLVAVVREPGKPRVIMDASADQFDRPGKLNVPGPVLTTVTGLWTPRDPMARVLADQTTVISYEPFAPSDPQGQDYLRARAWTRDPDWFEEMADAIAADLRNP